MQLIPRGNLAYIIASLYGQNTVLPKKNVLPNNYDQKLDLVGGVAIAVVLYSIHNWVTSYRL